MGTGKQTEPFLGEGEIWATIISVQSLLLALFLLLMSLCVTPDGPKTI